MSDPNKDRDAVTVNENQHGRPPPGHGESPQSAPGEETAEAEAEYETVVRSFGTDTLLGRIAYAVGIALALYHIWMSTFGQLNTLWLTGVHFAGFGFLCALRYPLINLKSAAGAKIVLAIDVLIGIVVAVSTLWLLYDVQDIFDRGRMEGIQTVLAL
ncbi:hypothetical protein, partial [Saliniramus sp.]|uniref:hypothetical protein n=1 Tax=Saliniramus sp. TaxID=2986772 RepID=UPI002B62AB23